VFHVRTWAAISDLGLTMLVQVLGHGVNPMAGEDSQGQTKGNACKVCPAGHFGDPDSP
jgi:hypothetical protein